MINPQSLETDRSVKQELLWRVYDARSRQVDADVRTYIAQMDEFITTNKREIDEARIYRCLLLSEEERAKVEAKESVLASGPRLAKERDSLPLWSKIFEVAEELTEFSIQVPVTPLTLDRK
jgi:hypothetical protein